MHRHHPLGIPRPLPPRDPSARRAGARLADTGPLEQGPSGWRPRSTSVPLGKDASAGAPAWNLEVAPDDVSGLLVCMCEGCASAVGETVPSVGAGTRLPHWVAFALGTGYPKW